MRLSLLLPIAPTRPEQVVTFANLVQWAGAARLWQGQGLVLDSYQVAAWLAGLGIRVPVGFGVSLMPFRSPYQAALEARSAALTTGHPVIAGFGPGSLDTQRAVLGRPYPSQLGAARDYVREVRAVLTGTSAAVLVKAPAPPVSVGLGVLRPAMAKLAGELADVAITWLVSADHLTGTLIPAIRSAQRTVPDPVRLTAIVPIGVAGPGRDVTDLVAAACGGHLAAPHYRDALSGAGITLSGSAHQDAKALVDGGVFLYGGVGEIHQRLAAYRDAGVAEVVLNATGVAAVHGPRAAAQDLLALLKAWPRQDEPSRG